METAPAPHPAEGHTRLCNIQETRNFSVPWKQPTSLQKDWLISDPDTRTPVLEGAKLMNTFFILQFCSLRGTWQSTAPAHTAPSLVCWALRRAVKHMLNSEHANSLSGKKIWSMYLSALLNQGLNKWLCFTGLSGLGGQQSSCFSLHGHNAEEHELGFSASQQIRFCQCLDCCKSLSVWSRGRLETHACRADITAKSCTLLQQGSHAQPRDSTPQTGTHHWQHTASALQASTPGTKQLFSPECTLTIPLCYPFWWGRVLGGWHFIFFVLLYISNGRN